MSYYPKRRGYNKHHYIAAVVFAFAVALGLCVIAPSAMAVVPNNTATVSDVTCDDTFNGQFNVELIAGEAETEDVQFIILVDSVSYGGDPDILVPPGQTQSVPVTDLDDGTHTVEVLANDVVVYPTSELEVACDEVPVEDYTNPGAIVYDLCDARIHLEASNKPIRGQFEGLQPVDFVVNTINENGVVTQLDAFTLPSEGEDDSFDREADYNLEPDTGVYEISVTADGLEIYWTTVDTSCVVIDDGGNFNPPPHVDKPDNDIIPTMLPNTGMSDYSSHLVFAIGLILLGSVMFIRGRKVRA